VSRATSVLNALKAEELLQGSFVLSQIDTLRNSLQYSTDSQTVSFDDMYLKLQGQVDGLPKLKLETAVATGTENQYIMQLVKALEEIYDQSDTLVRRVIHYQSKLKNAAAQIKKLSAAFNAWYTLAASELLEENSVKFPASQLKDLANSEFSRLMKNTDVEIDSLISAVAVQSEQIKQWKKTQQEKFGLGRDQANASWTSSLPNFGEAPERSDQLLEKPKFAVEEEDEIPQFISKKPQVTPPNNGRPTLEDLQKENAQRPVGTLVDRATAPTESGYVHVPDVFPVSPTEPIVVGVIGKVTPELEAAVKGVFQKTGPAVAITPIVTDTGKPPIIELPATTDIQQAAPTLPAALTSVFANAVEVKDPAKPAKAKKTALEYRVPVEGEIIVLRDSVADEKIKCVVCDRRIRSKQEMFARDGGYQHLNEGECTAKGGLLFPEMSKDTLTKLADAEDGCGPIMACSPEILAASGGDPNNIVAIHDAAIAKMAAVVSASNGTILADLEAKAAHIAAVSDIKTPDKGTWQPNQAYNVGDQIIDPQGDARTVQQSGTSTPVADAPATPRKRLTFLDDESEIL
jgi:hypothetical protein